MEYEALLILLALGQYLLFGARVGLGREKYNIAAPACEGNETWERLFRVHQNTKEQLIIMIPASLIFAYYLDGRWVLLPGLAFILGRFMYAAAYAKDPKTRGPGMMVTALANLALLLGGLVGVLIAIF